MKINRTVQRALLILDHVADSPNGVTQSNLIAALQLPKSSLFDLCSTLTEMHYLRKHGSKFYIGAKAKKIGNAYIEKQDLRDIAEPILTKASEAIQASSSLVLLDQGKQNYYFQYHPQDAIMVARQSSTFNIFHASATGKILLAYLPPAVRKKMISSLTLHKFTDKTIDDEATLLKSLETIREQGFALDNREYHYLLQCAAAPIVYEKKVIAAISFSGLNLYNDDPGEMIKTVMETAQTVSDSYTQAHE